MSWPVHQQIALKVFSLATSGVPSERMVSTFGFVHSKLRNCLSAENVKKLVYIKTNYWHLFKHHEVTLLVMNLLVDTDFILLVMVVNFVTD
jgi:hypothetical protein